jgi:hypothetical protein
LAVVTPSSKESDSKSTFIFIACLPYNSEPSYVHTMFDSEDKVAEIYSYGGEQAWVEFETPEHAAVAVANYDQYPFGPHSQKVFVDLVPREQVPKADSALPRYTEFVRQRDVETKSSTVFVSNLPNSNPIKNVNQMIEKIGLDGTYDDDEDDKLHGVKNMRIHPDEEGVLVRFYSVVDAAHFRHSYNGNYWKNNTLHVHYRPDTEIEELLHEQSGHSKDNTKLFLGGVRCKTTEDIRSTFRPVILNNVKIINGFAFVFLATADAVAVVDKRPNGMRLSNGRKIYPSPPKDKKDVAAFAAACAKIAAAPKGLAPVASKAVQRALPVALEVVQLSRVCRPSRPTDIFG